jgi:hypothetical protein
MSQKLILKISSLNTNSNQLSETQEGALAIAKNIVIDKDSVAESRRGFGFLVDPFASNLTRVDRLTSYQDHIIARRSSDDILSYYISGSGWSDYSGTYLNPDDDYARMRFVQASGNLYFTTSLGVKVLDVYTGPIYSTGMPQGLDGSGSTTGGSGFMTNNTQVAYRIVWGSKDTNNNLYLGAPSQRIIVANTSGGTRDISLTFTIPSGVTTSDFFQVYRSRESASSTDEPNDELQLVYEANPTSGEITAKSVTFTDSTTTSLMGAYLYTNSSQEGLTESNAQPPFAKDIAEFKGFMFYANVQTKQSLTINLLSIGGSNGLAVNDTITINSVVYTGKAAETVASAEFKVTTSGSASQNIEDTAKSLVKVINQYTSNTAIYAYYESGYQDLPGIIRLEKRTIDGAQFTVSVSAGSETAWDLDDGESDNSSYINGIMWSKTQQPEHVPYAHLEFVGSKNYAIRRIVALRDSLFILKDDGVFRLTGTNGAWSIDPLDTSTKIIAPDSAVVVNNQIFCLSDQGIVAISDIGVEVKSRAIEDQIQDLISEDYTNLKTLSFGINYETDRKYILFTITSDSDTYCTQAFVYNTFTNAWTKWNRNVTHGFVNVTDDKLYLSHAISENIYQERKTFTFTDFVDEEYTGYNVTAVSGTTVTLDSLSNIDIGDVLYQSNTVYSIITAYDPGSNTVTTDTSVSFSIATASILKAIDCEIEFTNASMENPGVMKRFNEVAWLFREKSFSQATAAYYTDLSGGYENTTLEGSFGADLWGAFTWGSVPWGGIQRPKPIRCFVPREKSRGSLLSVKLNVKNAYAKWSLNGVSIQYDYVSERMTRE